MRSLIPCLIACVIAQSAPPQFRARTDLVKLDVSVLYPDRQPVRGLEAQHFVILEDDVEQPVETFAEVVLPPPEPMPDGWRRDTPSDVIDNRDDPAGRLVAIVLDDGDPKMTVEVAKATAGVARDIIERLSPGDRGAIVYARQQKLSSVVTSDRAQLLAAVDRFTVDRDSFSPGEVYLSAARAASGAAVALASASDRRKILIYVSPGAPIDMTKGMYENDAAVYWQIERAVSAADRDNITIYTIDPTARAPSPPLKEREEKQRDRRRHFLDRFGEWGFGFAVLDERDYLPALDRIFAENTTYYTLGYRTPIRAKNDKPPDVEVRVRRQGLLVRARTTRVDPTPRRGDPKPKPVKEPPSRALQDVQHTALPQTDLPMRLSAAAFRVPGRNEALALLTVSSPDRTTREDDGSIAVAATAIRPFGPGLVRDPPTDYVSARGDAHLVLPLKPGYHRIHVGAESPAQQRLGSLRVPLDVPDYNTSPLAMSGVIVNSDAAVSAPAKLAGIVPFGATTARSFTRQDRLRAFVQIYIGGKQPGTPVSLKAGVRNAGGDIVYTLERTHTADDFGARGAVDVTVEPPLATLTPGWYLLTIEATRGETTVTRTVTFDVH